MSNVIYLLSAIFNYTLILLVAYIHKNKSVKRQFAVLKRMNLNFENTERLQIKEIVKF